VLQVPVVILEIVVTDGFLQVEITDFLGDREFLIPSLECTTDSARWSVPMPIAENSDGSTSERVDLPYLDDPRLKCAAASSTGVRSFEVGLPISADEIATSAEPCGPIAPGAGPIFDDYYCYTDIYPELVVSDGFVVGAFVHVDGRP